MRRLALLAAVPLALALFGGSALGQEEPPAPEEPPALHDTAFGEGHVLETDFVFRTQAGPNGEDPVGTLQTWGYLEWTATLTCDNAEGNAAVGGYRIETGRHAGEGFLAASVDNGPPVDGKPVDETLYSGYLPEPPVNCPGPYHPRPDGFYSTGGGPFTRGDWTLVNVDEQLPKGTPAARLSRARVRVTAERVSGRTLGVLAARLRICGKRGIALVGVAVARTRWQAKLRHSGSCSTHRITRPLGAWRAGQRYRVGLRARTTARQWSRTVVKRVDAL
jgi:hypothetical protein